MMTLFDGGEPAAHAEPVRAPRGRVLARIIPTVIALSLVAAGAWGALSFQRLVDQYTVWTFTPSAATQSIATASRMTAEGRFLFLASKPQVETAAIFDSSCASEQEGSGILGCYLPTGRTIHLFDVTDPRLAGLEDVVGAHEMLHAAWDRMNTIERQRLIPQLEAVASRLSDNADFTSRMAYYAKAEPGERDNELHSIIGTEVASIGPELEAHYAQYFSDRSALVALHEKSDAVFTDLQTRSAELSTAMAALKATIDSEYAQYTTGYDRLNADVRAFNARTDWTSNAEISRAKRSLEARRAALDAQYADIVAKHDQYNADYAALTSLTDQTNELYKGLNLQPALPSK
jgi:hypothetical protein